MTVLMTPAGIRIEHLDVEDVVVHDLLEAQAPERRDELVARALSVGARGVLSMGLGLDLAEVDASVRSSVEQVLTSARAEVGELFASAQEALRHQLDPDRASSAMGRTLAELTSWRDQLARALDPADRESHAARFVREIEDLVGKGGSLEGWLSAALDPHAEDTALGRLAQTLRDRLDALRDVVMREQGRRSEATLGTRKGFAFEDVVEEHVRQALRSAGAIVERTSSLPGNLGLVGDITVTLPHGEVVVIETKDQATIALTGREGILDELDRAMTNRGAAFAICVSAQDAFPVEVGSFAVYGDKLLLTELGDGTMVGVGLRWAAASLAASSVPGRDGIDARAIEGKLLELRSLAQLFSTNRRALTDIGRSVESVRSSLGDMRARLIALAEELMGDLRVPPGEVLELRPSLAVPESG